MITILYEANSNKTKALKKMMIVNRIKAVTFMITIISNLAAFVLFDLVSSNIIIISVIDFLGGAWTFLMLRKEGHFARKKELNS
jgi:hypothetical protein